MYVFWRATIPQNGITVLYNGQTWPRERRSRKTYFFPMKTGGGNDAGNIVFYLRQLSPALLRNLKEKSNIDRTEYSSTQSKYEIICFHIREILDSSDIVSLSARVSILKKKPELKFALCHEWHFEFAETLYLWTHL